MVKHSFLYNTINVLICPWFAGIAHKLLCATSSCCFVILKSSSSKLKTGSFQSHLKVFTDSWNMCFIWVCCFNLFSIVNECHSAVVVFYWRAAVTTVFSAAVNCWGMLVAGTLITSSAIQHLFDFSPLCVFKCLFKLHELLCSSRYCDWIYWPRPWHSPWAQIKHKQFIKKTL